VNSGFAGTHNQGLALDAGRILAVFCDKVDGFARGIERAIAAFKKLAHVGWDNRIGDALCYSIAASCQVRCVCAVQVHNAAAQAGANPAVLGADRIGNESHRFSKNAMRPVRRIDAWHPIIMTARSLVPAACCERA
jgi:hypothetical protein